MGVNTGAGVNTGMAAGNNEGGYSNATPSPQVAPVPASSLFAGPMQCRSLQISICALHGTGRGQNISSKQNKLYLQLQQAHKNVLVPLEENLDKRHVKITMKRELEDGEGFTNFIQVES